MSIRIAGVLIATVLTATLAIGCGGDAEAPSAQQATPTQRAQDLCVGFNFAAPLSAGGFDKVDLTAAEADRLVEEASAFAQDHPEWSAWAGDYTSWVQAAEPLTFADFDTLMNTGSGTPAPAGLETEHALQARFWDRVCSTSGRPAR